MGKKYCWYEMLEGCMKENGDDIRNMVCTLSEEELKVEFDAGYGGTEGEPFTAWGENWVYFPICYDGAEWVGSAPRNPCDVKMHHQGGGYVMNKWIYLCQIIAGLVACQFFAAEEVGACIAGIGAALMIYDAVREEKAKK